MSFLNTPSKSDWKHLSWITPKLWWGYLTVLLWTLGVTEKKNYRILWKRMFKLYDNQLKHGNSRFLFEHFRDYHRAFSSWIIGKRYTGGFSTRISLDSNGLPYIIPTELRIELGEKRNRVSIVVVSTLLAVYRVIPWWPKVDLSSVIDPFCGLSSVLHLPSLRLAKRKLDSLASRKFSLPSKISALNLQSASPTGKPSIVFALQDALSFWDERHKIRPLLSMLLFFKGGWKLAISFLLVLIIGLPWHLRCKALWKRTVSRPPKGWPMGRIAVVRDVAGKSRLITITNYWLQTALKPIHDGIFEYLKSIRTDGTFDQAAPVQAFNFQNKTYSSFDLTAATDRLPLQFQKQVMSLYLGRRLADHWESLVSFPIRLYGSKDIRYSVGQPMGAYSSWASLALSHHIVVQCCDKGTTEDYAIIGDDCSMDDKLGFEYQEIMRTLGLSISLPKSITSSSWIEFAKRLIDTSTGLDYQPIGPKLVVLAVRQKYFKVHLLAEAIRRLIVPREVSVSRMSEIGGDLSRFGLYLLFGPNGSVEKTPSFDLLFSKKKDGRFFSNYIPHSVATRAFRDSLSEYLYAELRRESTSARKERAKIYHYLKKISGSYPGPWRFLAFTLYCVSPLPWVLWSVLTRSIFNRPSLVLEMDVPSLLKAGGSLAFTQVEESSRKETKIHITKVRKIRSLFLRKMSGVDFSWALFPKGSLRGVKKE